MIKLNLDEVPELILTLTFGDQSVDFNIFDVQAKMQAKAKEAIDMNWNEQAVVIRQIMGLPDTVNTTQCMKITLKIEELINDFMGIKNA